MSPINVIIIITIIIVIIIMITIVVIIIIIIIILIIIIMLCRLSGAFFEVENHLACFLWLQLLGAFSVSLF